MVSAESSRTKGKSRFARKYSLVENRLNESTIDQIQDLLINCKRPKESSKYIEMQTTKWLLMQKAFEDTNFDPSQRPTAENMRYTSSNVHKTVSDQTSNSKIETDHLGDVKLALNQQQKTVDDKNKIKRRLLI